MAILCTLILISDCISNVKVKNTIKKQEIEMKKKAKDIITKISFQNHA
jgi:hypothetical protein